MVTEKTIQNCFAHWGFTAKNEEMLNPLHDVELPSNMTPETFHAVVDQDAELTDAEILEAKKDEIDETEDELDEEPKVAFLHRFSTHFIQSRNKFLKNE